MIQMHWLERVTLPLHSCHAPSFTLARTGEMLSCGRGFLKPGDHRFISGQALVNKHPGFLHLVGPLLQLLQEYYCRNLQDKETHRVTRVAVTEIPPLPTLAVGEVAGGSKKERHKHPELGSELLPALVMPESLFDAWLQNSSMLNSQCRLLFQEKAL